MNLNKEDFVCWTRDSKGYNVYKVLTSAPVLLLQKAGGKGKFMVKVEDIPRVVPCFLQTGYIINHKGKDMQVTDINNGAVCVLMDVRTDKISVEKITDLVNVEVITCNHQNF